MNHEKNLLRIQAIHSALGPLQNEVVFVGGATVSLYVDRMAEEVRETEDIDLVVDIWTHREFAIFEEKLRKVGFLNDRESRIICRYRFQDLVEGIVLDVMPTGENVLGFKNQWYARGFNQAVVYKGLKGLNIKIFAVPYFIASKIDAFRDRGGNDGRQNPDFEDIIFILENRNSVWEDMETCPADVRNYLKLEFSRLLGTPHFEEWVDANVSIGSPPATEFIIRRLSGYVTR